MIYDKISKKLENIRKSLYILNDVSKQEKIEKWQHKYIKNAVSTIIQETDELEYFHEHEPRITFTSEEIQELHELSKTVRIYEGGFYITVNSCTSYEGDDLFFPGFELKFLS